MFFDTKSIQNKAKMPPKLYEKIRRPSVGRVRPPIGGGLPPPTPSALGPSPPTPRPNRRKNTLYVYWFHTLAHGNQILQRGVSGFLALWAPFSYFGERWAHFTYSWGINFFY